VATALRRLLSGTGFVARPLSARVWRIERRQTVNRQPPSVAPKAIQSSAPPPEIVGQTIVVTGAKREIPLDDLPMAVSVAMLDAGHRLAPGTGTSTIASDMEGLSLTGLGPGRNRMAVRGVSDSAFSGESQSTVAVVLDESRLTYSAPDPDLRLVDVKRVEVLKGPQGSLYGTGALGGIYHIVSQRADLNSASLDVSAGAEVVAKGGAGYSGSLVANLPVLADRAAIRLVGYTALEPGWVNTGSRVDANALRVSGARAGLGIDLGAGWRADATGLGQWIESRDSQYVYDRHARSRPAQLPEPHDNDLVHAALRLAREDTPVRIVLASGMTWHSVDDRLDATIGADSLGLADPQILADDRKYRVWDSEMRVSGDLAGWSWLAGISYLEAKQDADLTLRSASDVLVLDSDRRVSKEAAIFADLSVPIANVFEVSVGGRAFHAVTHESRILAGSRVSSERNRYDVTPTVSLSWQANARTLLFVRYGSAFRQGGVDVNQDGTVNNLKGDELGTVEIGWRQEIGRDGRLDVGAWYSWWENVQSDELQPDGLIETRNAGNARIVGIEASLDQPLSAGWRLRAGANFTYAELTRNTLGIELDNTHLPAVPKYTLRTGLSREFTLGAARASLSAQLRYVGPMRLSFDPLIDRPMGRYVESVLEAQMQWDRYGVLLAIDNPLARSDDQFAFGNSLRFATMRQFTPQRPTRISLSVRRSF